MLRKGTILHDQILINQTGAVAATGDTSNATLYILLGATPVVLMAVRVILIRRRNQSNK